jgi:uncharacterized protein (TIGR00255 family)
MPLKSMTGFGRAGGHQDGASWTWEVRTVNSRGLDIRFRLPSGFEEFELRLREAMARAIARGNCAVNLILKLPASAGDIRLNEAVLRRFAELAERAREVTGRGEPVPLEALLASKGVIEAGETEPGADGAKALQDALFSSFQLALAAVVEARKAEGGRLEAILDEKLAEIEQLVGDAEQSPARRPETIQERLRAQLQRIFNESVEFDRDRLYQEAALLAAKADVEEELKRLRSHIAGARDLLADDQPAGRKFEFLAQEFQREANTLCAKSNAAEITRIGLRLKSAIDHFREQVQNVE